VFSDEEKEEIKTVIKETESWITSNADGSKEDFEEKLKDLQEKLKNHMAKFQQANPQKEGG